MSPQELRALQEAYSQVYELDEAITSEKGKAKAAEMIAARTTASGRAKPGKGANVAQIRQISRSNREGLGGTPMTPTMAKNPVKKKNYDGTGNKAARRAGTYQEEVENWVNSLIEEGYDLSEYSWDDMYEMYVTEGDNYDKNRKRAAQRAAARNEARAKGQTGNVPGVGYVTPRRERETYTDAAGTERHKTGARMPKKDVQKEQVDLYDIILSHLLDEGYADTQEAAEAIMVNMSEDWRESIVEATYKPSGSAAPTDIPSDTRMTVTAADKAGNTKAYQNFKAGDPAYKAASHLKGV